MNEHLQNDLHPSPPVFQLLIALEDDGRLNESDSLDARLRARGLDPVEIVTAARTELNALLTQHACLAPQESDSSVNNSNDSPQLTTCPPPTAPSGNTDASVAEVAPVLIPRNTSTMKKPNHSAKKRKNVPFANYQLEVDTKQKDLVSRFIARHKDFGLRTGDGVFFDAGSQGFAQYQATIECVLEGQYSHLTAHTNNLMVVQEWCREQWKPALQGMTLDIVGEKLDAPHLALYGPAGRQALLASDFRPAQICIGISGIEFGDGKIFCGYHSGENEKEMKAALFESRAGIRFMLATPRKIGHAGAKVFDILSIAPKTKAPLYLVTTAPQSALEEREFLKAKEACHAELMEENLRNHGIEFHWLILEQSNDGVPEALEHIVINAMDVRERPSEDTRGQAARAKSQAH